jgi:hypothetical protein
MKQQTKLQSTQPKKGPDLGRWHHKGVARTRRGAGTETRIGIEEYGLSLRQPREPSTRPFKTTGIPSGNKEDMDASFTPWTSDQTRKH